MKLPFWRLLFVTVPVLVSGGFLWAGETWSLRPLRPFPVPEISGKPGLHPIDAFVETALLAKAMKPSPAADARSLLRRVEVDLTGLPPTWEEMQAYLSEITHDPAAYEKAVDRLLASPRYGERWARHWLDTIHFADTHGYEHDVFRPNAWRFRDYVIRAFNADTPWPRFIREQLAADVFFPEETGLVAALGFLGAGPFDASAESTAQAQYEYADRDDLVTQTMSAFASTTAHCARCHAHKFDPISQEDYFALQAVFAGVGKGDVPFDEDAANAKARTRWAKAPQEPLTAENQALVAAWEAAKLPQDQWVPFSAETFTSALGAVLTKQADGAFLASGPRPDMDSYIFTGSIPLPEITGLRLDLLADDSLPLKGPGRETNGNTHVSELELSVFRAAAPQASQRVALARGSADFDQSGYGAAGLTDGDPKTSWAIHPNVGQSHYAVVPLAAPLALKPEDRLVLSVRQLQGGHQIGKLKISFTQTHQQPLLALSPTAQTALETPGEQRTEAQRIALATPVLAGLAEAALAKIPAQVAVYGASAGNQAARGAILKAPQPRVIRLLNRGDLNQPGAEVPPGALSALSHLPARFSLPDPSREDLRRAALADWLAHGENRLTWRSIVNRVWHYHFGKGLCDTPSDFGRMGGQPSHPELLDWLAVWFRDEAKGSLKALSRLIVTSAAYQRTSISTEYQSLDPENRLHWRGNRQRLDADTVRDAMLQASGQLDLQMGGPPVAQYTSRPGPQATPVLDYAAFNWNSPGAGRRSIYRVVYRGIPDPFMEALDFPDLGMTAPVRGFSASPLQSMALFNNPFTLNQSKHLAERAKDITTMVHGTLLREPTPEEIAAYGSLASAHGLPAVARLLLNTNEFLFLD